MNGELTAREMAIEGYGYDYKGVLPDGTVTGVMSYDGKVFEHYVESGSWGNRHPNWERNYKATPLRTPLEILATNVDHPAMHTDEVVYEGTIYQEQPMGSVGMSGWRYDYHDKMRFRRLILRGEIELPAPAVFSQYGNIYIESGYEAEVDDLFWEWARSNGHQSVVKTQSAEV